MQPPVPQQPSANSKKFPTWAIVLIACGVGCLPVLGVVSALAIYGVRKYIAAAKTSEAKSTVGAISRAAVAAYEKPVDPGTGAGALCDSAIPVPTSVPKGRKYQPASTDFLTGTPTAGWTCLKFSMTTPIYYQYHYSKGSRYQSPVSPPGPDGFEAAAVGDLDGDGVTSLFARTGQIDSRGEIVVSSSIYIDNESE